MHPSTIKSKGKRGANQGLIMDEFIKEVELEQSAGKKSYAGPKHIEGGRYDFL